MNPTEKEIVSTNAHQEKEVPTVKEKETPRYFPMLAPFEFMRRFPEEVENFFNSFTPRLFSATFPFAFERPPAFARWMPRHYPATFTLPVDLLTRGNDLIIRAEMPGIKPEEIEVEMDQSGLTIRGKSHFEEKKEEEGYFYSERRYGTFFRYIPLPPEFKNIEPIAEFKDGILEVTLPETATIAFPERRKIAIKTPTPEAEGTIPQPVSVGHTEEVLGS
jgi:HSP20 family protein